MYRAIDRRTQETVAVKFLSKRLWHDSAAIESFQSEIALLSKLRHPNIVAIQGYGRTTAGAPFFVMEYIAGSSLAACMKSNHLEIADIVAIGIHIARAVAAAHSRDVIHGDLTPSNVLQEDETGRIALTDFGFSRATHQKRFAMLGGTPGYLAPEQVSDAFGDITTRTDIYGIGGILYALLAGRPPFTGETTADIMADVLSSRLPASPVSLNSSVTTKLADLILSCLAKESADRPDSAETVAARLSEIAENMSTLSDHSTPAG